MRRLAWIVGLSVLSLVAAIAFFEIRNRIGVHRAEAEFAARRPAPMGDFGTTQSLSILPLVDWHASDPELRAEMGVSYLIETDSQRILFDVGHNAKRESPSPLEHNMEALGVALGDIDTLFISHNHFDHVGGEDRQKNRTFGVGLAQVPLPGLRAFVPIPMTYPGLSPIHSREPAKIGDGVSSTGTIARQLVFGWIDEQALVVRVEGLGNVLIVGCGHQGIAKLLERYDQVFSAPLYGIVGGLHYPVPHGRLTVLGLNAQRRFASGDGMLAPIEMNDVESDLRLLRRRGLGLVGVGGHDSSDEVIEMFANRFGEAYRHIRVGERIVVGATRKPY